MNYSYEQHIDVLAKQNERLKIIEDNLWTQLQVLHEDESGHVTIDQIARFYEMYLTAQNQRRLTATSLVQAFAQAGRAELGSKA